MTDLATILAQLQPSQLMSGVNATLNIAAIAAVLVVRAEIKALRNQIERIETFIADNTTLKGKK